MLWQEAFKRSLFVGAAAPCFARGFPTKKCQGQKGMLCVPVFFHHGKGSLPVRPPAEMHLCGSL